MKIHEWIKSNTYHHSSFSDIGQLVELKRKNRGSSASTNSEASQKRSQDKLIIGKFLSSFPSPCTYSLKNRLSNSQGNQFK